MRTASSFFAIFLAAAPHLTPLVHAVDVASCVEFAAVDRKTETDVTITTADFACDEYTRLSIRSDMVLKSSVGAVTFSNFSLKVYGSLTVEPDVIFTGITNADTSGGALKVQRDAVVVFQGTADFMDISVKPRDDEETFIVRKGAAIFSNGAITFEKDASFTGCYNDARDTDFIVSTRGDSINYLEPVAGGGGAIYQNPKGTMRFMGALTMNANEAFDYQLGARGEGGAFYNKGDVVVDGEADFTDNNGMEGGAIYQERWGTFEFKSFVNFQGNRAANQWGGAIMNNGGKITCNAGSSFNENVATSNGEGGTGGGIFNFDGGVVTLVGSTSFTNNEANRAGAFMSLRTNDGFEEREGRTYKPAVITFPEDTLFEGNVASLEFCPDIMYEYNDETCGL